MRPLSRRSLLAALSLAPLAVRAALHGHVALGAAWRGPAADDAQQVGVLDVDGPRRTITIRHAVTLPSRAHGLMAEAGGGLLVVAARPGTWLLRVDGEGRTAQRFAIEDEAAERRFDGHVLASADGRWLYTGETDARGEGWLAVREGTSLRKTDQWRTHGIDPHQMVLDAEGHIVLANGGIPRTPDGRKRDLHRMQPSLVRLDHRGGTLLGRWTLEDPRLSLRHLAWSGDGQRLGVALQAEHDDAVQRARAPLLAVWDGDRLVLPLGEAQGEGYAGDIAALPAGGFALSAQRARRGLAWWPQRAAAMARFAEVEEPCALAADGDGALLMACGAGLARWHPSDGAAMLRWPQPMALDNHWVLIRA